MPKAKKHNREINEDIREENEEFNKQWIAKNQLIGDDIVLADERDVSLEVRLDASPFMVVWLKNIERLYEMFCSEFDYKSFSLLDVGCGSGISTFFFHQNYDFDRCDGFDFSSSLIGLASKNKKIISNNGVDTSSISFEIGDAKQIKIQDKRYAVFMFNPFGWETMSEFVSNNIEVLRKNKSVILYANDICVNNLLEFGRIVKRDDIFNLSVIAFGD
jgi:SAM-dependent methyltransferase